MHSLAPSSSSTTSRKFSVLRLALAMGIAAHTIDTASAKAKEIPTTSLVAGVYPLKSKNAKIQSRIDLDLIEMERFISLDLKSGDSGWLKKAEEIYKNGEHAGAYANLHLKKPLDHDVILPKPIGTAYSNGVNDRDISSHDIYELNVIGATDETYGIPLHGVFTTTDPGHSLKKGTTDKLTVSYPQESKCTIGIRDECFAGPEGSVILQGYGPVEYSYDPRKDNRFAYTLKGYSEEEGLRMYYCENHGGCGNYQEYQHYFDYYGILDYGDHWIESAFAGTSTEYSSNDRLLRGNVDFSVFSNRARTAAIKTATVAMNVFTGVNRLMVEYAVGGCKKNSKDFKSYGNSHSMESVINAWDQAVATYAGSALFWNDEGSESDSGSLYYNMVDELARDFGVVDSKAFPHRSTVNKYIMDEFVEGKKALEQGDCQDMGGVEKAYYMILHKMRTPWIQGILRASFVLSGEEEYFDEERRDEERGRGAAFLAALLPDLHMCSPNTAQRVYDDFIVSYGSNQRVEYNELRELIEPHYECLGVTCAEVGGFLNPSTGDYYPGTHPCGGYGRLITQRRESALPSTTNNAASPSSSSAASSPVSTRKGMTVSSFFGMSLLVFGASLAVLVVVVRDRAHGRPVSISRAAQRLASGVVGAADYWMSSGSNPFARGGGSSNPYEAGYELHSNTDYDVDFRSSSRVPLQPGSNDFVL